MLNTLTFNSLTPEVLYRFSVRRQCDDLNLSTPAVVLFSTVGIVVPPADCVPLGLTTQRIRLPKALEKSSIFGPNTGNFVTLRMRTNNGTWAYIPGNPGLSMYDVDTGGIQFPMSSPDLSLNLPGLDACLEIELGFRFGITTVFPGDIDFLTILAAIGSSNVYAVEGIACRGMGQANILNVPLNQVGSELGASQTLIEGENITPMTPDYTTAYNGVNEFYSPATGYYRWKLQAYAGFQGIVPMGPSAVPFNHLSTSPFQILIYRP